MRGHFDCVARSAVERLLLFRPFHDLPEPCFHIFIRCGDRHPDKALPLLPEGGPGDEPHSGLVEEALADLERGHLQGAEIEKEVEGSLWRRDQYLLALELMRD